MLADRLANARYVATADGLLTMARVLADSLDNLEWVMQTIAEAQAVLPMTDPTTFQAHKQNLHDQAELFRPLLTAAQELAPILERHAAAARIG